VLEGSRKPDAGKRPAFPEKSLGIEHGVLELLSGQKAQQ
jgi:hypothetical protein